MQPSETSRGERWLLNFAEPDRISARLLVDSIDFVSETKFRLALQKIIEELPKKLVRLSTARCFRISADLYDDFDWRRRE